MEEAQREKDELVQNMALLQQEKEQLEADKERLQKECEQERERYAQLRKENQVSRARPLGQAQHRGRERIPARCSGSLSLCLLLERSVHSSIILSILSTYLQLSPVVSQHPLVKACKPAQPPKL